MESDEVIKTIDQIEAISKDLIANSEPSKRSEQCAFLAAQLDDLMRKIVKQIDVAEKEFLTEIIELVIMVNKRYNFDEILGTGVKYALLTSYINALIYQKDWKFDKLSECLTVIERTYAGYLGMDSRKTALTVPSKIFRGVDQIFGPEVMKRIRLCICYCDAMLQHTAVFSQIGQHEEALNSCLKCFDVLTAIIERFADIFGAIKLIGPENIKGLGLFTNDINDYDIYLEFLKTVKMPKAGQNEPWSNSVPNWKINKENNLKYIFQKIDAQRQQAGMKILPRKLEKDWVETFHISNIVKLQSFEDFAKRLEVDDFDEDLILRVILTMACCIFSVAAENRFISFKEIQSKGQSAQSQADGAPPKPETDKKKPKVMDDMSKDLRLQKEPRFILSEKIHMKTLEILTFGLKDSIRLLNHCFQSYKKNYDLGILMIEEVDEPSFTTIRTSEYFYNNVDESGNLEEIDKLNQRIKKLVNSDKNKDDKVYEEEQLQKPKVSTDKIKVSGSGKMNVYTSLYGAGKGIFVKAKGAASGSGGAGQQRDSEGEKPHGKFNIEVDDNAGENTPLAAFEKQNSRTPTTVVKPMIGMLNIDSKGSARQELQRTRDKETDVSDSNSKERIMQRGLFKAGDHSLKTIKFDRIREQVKVDSSVSKNRNRLLGTGYKTGLSKDFLRTMENNTVRQHERFEPEKSEDRLHKIKREEARETLFNPSETGALSLRNIKANSLSREHLLTRKQGAASTSNLRASRDSKQADTQEPSTEKLIPGTKFSQLINQINHNSKNQPKSVDKPDFLGIIKSVKSGTVSTSQLLEMMRNRQVK